MIPIPGTLFVLVFVSADTDQLRARTDLLVLVVHDNRLEMPQFGISVTIEGDGREAFESAVRQVIRELVIVHGLLDGLGDGHLNEVGRAQIQLLDAALHRARQSRCRPAGSEEQDPFTVLGLGLATPVRHDHVDELVTEWGDSLWGSIETVRVGQDPELREQTNDLIDRLKHASRIEDIGPVVDLQRFGCQPPEHDEDDQP